MDKIKISYWVIMDKNKKAIACGTTRDRKMRLIAGLDKTKPRIILYGTKKRAIAGYSDGLGFYDETEGYLNKKYSGVGFHNFYEKICTPVEVSLEIDLIMDTEDE